MTQDDPQPDQRQGPPDPPSSGGVDSNDQGGDDGRHDELSDAAASVGGDGHDDSAQADEVLAPFSPQDMRRELRTDTAMRWAVAVAVFVAVAGLMAFDRTGSFAGLALGLLLVMGWIAVNSISAGVWRALPRVTAMIGPNPSAAEAALALHLKRRPLMRWIRLMLYDRLASIRHRQHRFAESAAICQAVLSLSVGPMRRQRGGLLLMLAEARLQCRDFYGAYLALTELHREKLPLAESLQRLALQTRYEVLAGLDRAALSNTRQKLLLSELMPSMHCGAMHAMLTVAASRTGQVKLADWLGRRSLLLCGPKQIDRLVKSAFAVGIVNPPDPGGGAEG